jgi:hypothetical protein
MSIVIAISIDVSSSLNGTIQVRIELRYEIRLVAAEVQFGAAIPRTPNLR